jgi:hypothetical protein
MNTLLKKYWIQISVAVVVLLGYTILLLSIGKSRAKAELELLSKQYEIKLAEQEKRLSALKVEYNGAQEKATESIYKLEILTYKYDSITNVLKSKKRKPSRPNYANIFADSLSKLWSKHAKR